MRLGDAVTDFYASMEGVLRPRSIGFYHDKLRELLRVLGPATPLAEVTLRDLRSWRAIQAQRGFKLHTLHGSVRAVRRFFNWCVAESYLTDSPAKRLELPRLPDNEPKAVDPADLARLLAEARSKPRNFAILCFLADTGCRVSGLVSLKLCDVDLERARAIIRSKGGRERALFLSPATVAALRAYLVVRPPDRGDAFWIGERGPLTRTGVYAMLHVLARRAGIKGRFNPHAFRHGAARGMLQNGADLGTVSQLLGHADLETTHRYYARWTQDELAERHRRYSWLAGTDSADCEQEQGTG